MSIYRVDMIKIVLSLMKNFAKFDKGYISLQGDHGKVSFRNIKIRSITEAAK